MQIKIKWQMLPFENYISCSFLSKMDIFQRIISSFKSIASNFEISGMKIMPYFWKNISV